MPNSTGTQRMAEVMHGHPPAVSHPQGLGITDLPHRLRTSHDSAAMNLEVITSIPHAGEEGRPEGAVRPASSSVANLFAGNAARQRLGSYHTLSYSASASSPEGKRTTELSPKWEASSPPSTRRLPASRNRRSMPGLPSQQKSSLAYSLARQPASKLDLDGTAKCSPPLLQMESKRARRGAKHQRRKSMGATTNGGGVQKATTATTTSSAAGSSSSSGSPADLAAAGLKFMNYTPDNKEDILKGVAPSGSGKTKQRRDREAARREREFRALVSAGLQGDMGKLEDLERRLQG
jgi:hypothetical protein